MVGYLLSRCFCLCTICDHKVLNINDRKLLIALRTNASIRGPGQVSEP